MRSDEVGGMGSHGDCGQSENPALSSRDCGHADVSNETASPDFYVRSLVVVQSLKNSLLLFSR